MSRLVRMGLGCLVISLTVGCTQRQFNIRMSLTPDNTVRRSIELSIGGDQNNSSAELNEFASYTSTIYGAPSVKTDRCILFENEFKETLPSDLEHHGFTNYGAVSVFENPLGRAVVYFERMPGRTHWTEFLDTAQKTIDLLIRGLVAYAKQHPDLQQEPDKLAALTSFLEGQFKTDLTDASVMCWLTVAHAGQSSLASGNSWEKELIARFGSFLIERGYVRPAEIFAIVNDDYDGFIMGCILRRISQVLGHSASDPLPPALAQLQQENAIQNMLDIGFDSLGLSDEERKEWVSGAQEMSPLNMGDTTTGTVVWQTDHEPAETNGTWDKARGEVRWLADGLSSPYLPELLWAIWSIPNERFQKEHFGRVILKEALPMYGEWYASLTSDEAIHWDHFLTGLKPGPELIPQLREFRVNEITPVDTASANSFPKKNSLGVSLLLESLEPPMTSAAPHGSISPAEYRIPIHSGDLASGIRRGVNVN